MNKTLTTLSLLCLMCAGCVDVERDRATEIIDYRWKVITIDGCQYIESTRSDVPLTHKGNCKNKIHYDR